MTRARKISYIMFALFIGSCGKSESVLEFNAGKDSAYLVSLASTALPLALNVSDSLLQGDTLSTLATTVKFIGDTVNFPNQEGTATFLLTYDDMVDSDLRYKDGSMRVIFYKPNSDYKYAVVYDSISIDGYFFVGSVLIKESSETNESHMIRSYNLKVYGRGRKGSINVNGTANVSSASDFINYNFLSTTGRSSDDRRFKYSGDTLTYSKSCSYLVGGSLYVKPSFYEGNTVDFGDNSCDNRALISITGNTLTIPLP